MHPLNQFGSPDFLGSERRGSFRLSLTAGSKGNGPTSLRNIPAEIILQYLVENSSERIQQSFSRRLGYLHDEPIAKSIVQGWLAPGGLLGEPKSLDHNGLRMFRNVAPVDPVAALKAVRRAASDCQFVAVNASNRQQFSRLVRQIGYDSEHFETAVDCLLLFAEVEPPDHRNDPVREMVSSLFFSHLSGTVAPIPLRAKIVGELLGSVDARRREIGLSCLESALEAEYFSSHYEFDFGSRKRSYGWWPKTRGDVVEWQPRRNNEMIVQNADVSVADLAAKAGGTQSSQNWRARCLCTRPASRRARPTAGSRATVPGPGVSDRSSAPRCCPHRLPAEIVARMRG